MHVKSPAGHFDTPHGVCGGGGAQVLQVVAEAAGIVSRLALDQTVGKMTYDVDIMVVLPTFLVMTYTDYRSFAYIVDRPLKSKCLHFIALTLKDYMQLAYRQCDIGENYTFHSIFHLQCGKKL